MKKLIIPIFIITTSIYASQLKPFEIADKLEISQSLIQSIKTDKYHIKQYNSDMLLDKPESYYLLALSLLKNDKYIFDVKTLKRYFLKAAINGHTESQRILSLMYYFGIGGNKNNKISRMYMEVSASEGNLKAKIDWDRYNFYKLK